ncbi:MAG: 3D domain-containing protein [Peptostreptococcus sp.]|uniref:3D domain-containing protein n=1 Tax=Peptostreptococcus sp. TaxID=1262 RepID=UPI002FC659FB
MKKIFSIAAAVLMTSSVFLSASTLNIKADSTEGVKFSSEMGWKKVGNNYNYINSSGNKAVGWNRLNGLWYYFNQNGDMVRGVQTISNKTYLFNENGSLNKEIKSDKQSSNNSNENNQSNSNVSTEVIKEPAKKDPNMVYDKSGNPLGTGKKYVSNASAYTGDTTTASGQRPRWGTIAVDPKVIPLGSKVYVPYFDKVFIANDTGGIIRGTMIDIFMKSASNMNNFGRRNIDIYVLNQ